MNRRSSSIDLFRWRRVNRMWNVTTSLYITSLLKQDVAVFPSELPFRYPSLPFPRLHSLSFDLAYGFVPRNIDDLLECRHLTSLQFVTDDRGFETLPSRLPSLSTLESLSFKQVRCWFAGVKDSHLSPLTKLTHLTLDNARISSSCLASLTRLSSLSLLGSVLFQLSDLCSLNLTRLDCTAALLTDESVSSLTTLLSLSLDLQQRISDDGVSTLVNLTHLETQGNTITDRSLICLTNLRSLLVRRSCHITKHGVQLCNSLENIFVEAWGEDN